MKFQINTTRIFQVICFLIVLWSISFVKKTANRGIPDTSLPEIESSWKEDVSIKEKIKKNELDLNKLRQHISLVDDTTKELRNVFAIPILIPEKFFDCEECGGPNKEGVRVCRHCGAIIASPTMDSDSDGIPDYWEIKYQLDPNDADDANLDPDEDGRTNLVEFQDDTNPLISDVKGAKESESIKQLPFELVKTYQKPIQIIFMGYISRVSGEYEVQINWAGKTDFYKIGDIIRGYQLKDFQKVEVEEFDEKAGVGKFIDKSYIICQKKKFPPKTFLKQKLVTDNDVFAKIRFSDSAREREVYIDSVIEDTITGKVYKVIDIVLKPAKLIVEDDVKKHLLFKTQ